MHLTDGTPLPAAVLAGSVAAAALATVATTPALAAASPARVAAATSVFFVASQLPVPIPPTSVHLSFVGLTGVLLGRAAFPAIVVGLTLQKALLGHGGWTTLPVNCCTMGGGALVAAAAYHGTRGRPAWRAAGAAAAGALAALLLYGAALLSAGDALRTVAWVSLGAHAPVALVEVLVTARAATWLERVQPELLGAEPGPEAT